MKNNFKTVCILFFGLFILVGCTPSPTPAMDEYRLSVALPIKNTDTTKCAKKLLKVEQAYGDKLFMSLKMHYVQGKYKQYAYAQSKWAQSPNEKITQSITEYLRAMHLFKSVQNAASKTKNDLRLEVNIEDFMQYFDENEKNSYVNIAITCNLIDDATHKIVAVKTFKVHVKAKSDDAFGGVAALNEGLKIFLKECGLWLQGVCLDKRKRV